MSNSALYDNMDGRGERRAYNSLEDGEFRPLKISKDVENLFETKAMELGVSNPFFRASTVIDRIQGILERVSLEGDLFPDLVNPLRVPIIPDLVGQVNQTITQTGSPVATTASFGVGLQNTNIDAVTGLTREQDLIYNNPTDRAIARKQNQQKKVIT